MNDRKSDIGIEQVADKAAVIFERGSRSTLNISIEVGILRCTDVVKE
jgi:hypothetical protein